MSPPSQTTQTPGSSRGVDLLGWKPVRGLFLWSGFPYVFQLLILVPVVGLAALGWGWLTPPGVPDKLYARTNLVNLVVWGLFWPGIVWLTVLCGRVWCIVCPLELVANVTERAGRRLGIPQRALGRWLQAGWLVLALYAGLQMLVAGLHLHRVPAYTSLFLWGLVLVAALTGLLYRDRAFCRGFCPVELLLKVYGRGGMLAVRAGSPETCSQCSSKDCVHSAHRNNLDGRSCPSLLNPAGLRDSQDCLLCGQCFKVCRPDNIQLLLRQPFHSADSRAALAGWPATLFVLMVSGFVTSEVASEWGAAKTLFLRPVEAVAGWWQAPSTWIGWIEGVWTLLVFPAFAWLVLGGMLVALRSARSLPEAWRRMALPLAVVIAAGHMAKGLAKFVSWAGFTPLAVSEPDGVRNALAIAAKTMAQPASWIPLWVVSLAGLALMASALWYANREVRLVSNPATRLLRAPNYLVAGVFGFVIFGWGFLQ